jgi:hypothetical protein
MYSEAISLKEMQDVVGEIADLQTTSPRWKDRVSAVSRAVGLPWSRAKDFYYLNARSVKDHEGRAARAALREIKARKKAHDQHSRLQQTIAYLRETDQDFHSPTIDRLERSFAQLGVLDSTLDETDE